MLRNDTIYLLDKDQDSLVPTTEVIKYQVEKCTRSISGSVRLAEGRVVGEDKEKTMRRRGRKSQLN